MLIFDIETGPIDDRDLLRELSPPFTPPPHPGEFDEGAVKYGNLKDEAKRAEKLKDARAAHDKAVAEYGLTTDAARTQHWADTLDKAALSPITGQVVAVGYFNPVKGGSRIAGLGEAGEEAAILAEFWSIYESCRAKNSQLAGWNITGFDVPFLVKRSWLHGVDVPNIFDRTGKYLDQTFVDLMVRFGVGKWGDSTKLDVAARWLGVGAKNGEGKEFAKLWRAGGEEREQARAYLANDLAMTAAVAAKMGMV